MWKEFGKNIQMAEGDFGNPLPMELEGSTLTASDTLKFVFKGYMNGETILEKELTPENNACSLTLTEAESALFPVGTYVFRVDLYQNGEYLNNIIPSAIFKVVDKA